MSDKLQCGQECRMGDVLHATCEKPARHIGRHRGISIDTRLDAEWDRHEGDTCAPEEPWPWWDGEGIAVFDSVSPKEPE